MSFLDDVWDRVTDTASGWAADALGWSPDTRYSVTTWLQGQGKSIATGWGQQAASGILSGIGNKVSGGLSGWAVGAYSQQASIQQTMRQAAPYVQQFAQRSGIPAATLMRAVESWLQKRAGITVRKDAQGRDVQYSSFGESRSRLVSGYDANGNDFSAPSAPQFLSPPRVGGSYW